MVFLLRLRKERKTPEQRGARFGEHCERCRRQSAERGRGIYPEQSKRRLPNKKPLLVSGFFVATSKRAQPPSRGGQGSANTVSDAVGSPRNEDEGFIPSNPKVAYQIKNHSLRVFFLLRLRKVLSPYSRGMNKKQNKLAILDQIFLTKVIRNTQRIYP